MSQQQTLSTVKLILETYELLIALYVCLIDETNPEQRTTYRADIKIIRSHLAVLSDELEDIIKNAR